MSLLPHADSLGIATQIGRRPVDEVYNPFFLGDLPNDNLLAQPECPNGRQAATDVFIGGACPDEIRIRKLGTPHWLLRRPFCRLSARTPWARLCLRCFRASA